MWAEEYDGLKPRRERMRMKEMLSPYANRVPSPLIEGQGISPPTNLNLKTWAEYDTLILGRIGGRQAELAYLPFTVASNDWISSGRVYISSPPSLETGHTSMGLSQ